MLNVWGVEDVAFDVFVSDAHQNDVPVYRGGVVHTALAASIAAKHFTAVGVRLACGVVTGADVFANRHHPGYALGEVGVVLVWGLLAPVGYAPASHNRRLDGDVAD